MHQHRFGLSVLLLLLGLLVSASALPNKMPNASASVTYAPIGYVQYCITYAKNDESCGVKAEQQKPKLLLYTESFQRIVSMVQTYVNSSIEYAEDIDVYGLPEWWAYFDSDLLSSEKQVKGDCDDYVLTKLHWLMKLGVPRENLHILFVRGGKNAGHVLLAVKTNQGDWILDSNVKYVMSRDEAATHYKFEAEEQPFTGGQWLPVKR